jgi:hypothetical protein
MMWKPGDTALLRYRRMGPVTYALPTTVVADAPGLTMLYLRPGTPIKRRVLADGQPIPRHLPYVEQAAFPVIVGDGIWTANHALILVRPGDAHDIRLFWSEHDWIFRGWYVNLQRPVRRVSVGFDTADHVLDLFVEPEGAWHWKDEDELAAAVGIGRFTPDDAAAIRAEGECVVRRIDARAWPFDAPYERWRPDPTWSMPAMPADWNSDA